jgi:hypothetical protein
MNLCTSVRALECEVLCARDNQDVCVGQGQLCVYYNQLDKAFEACARADEPASTPWRRAVCKEARAQGPVHVKSDMYTTQYTPHRLSTSSIAARVGVHHLAVVNQSLC